MRARVRHRCTLTANWRNRGMGMNGKGILKGTKICWERKQQRKNRGGERIFSLVRRPVKLWPFSLSLSLSLSFSLSLFPNRLLFSISHVFHSLFFSLSAFSASDAPLLFLLPVINWCCFYCFSFFIFFASLLFPLFPLLTLSSPPLPHHSITLSLFATYLQVLFTFLWCSITPV